MTIIQRLLIRRITLISIEILLFVAFPPSLSFATTEIPELSEQSESGERAHILQENSNDGNHLIREFAEDYPNPTCIFELASKQCLAWFWEFDAVCTSIHSNARPCLYNSSELPLRGAQFYGKVLTASSNFRCGGYNQGGGCPDGYASFYEGYELNMPAVCCSLDYSEAEVCADPTYRGITLDPHETWITFNPDATMWIYQPDGDPPFNTPPNGTLYPILADGVVALPGTAEDGDMHIRGTLRGRLTLLTGRAFHVEGDLLYARDPRFEPSDDALGLLAGWKTPDYGHLIIPDIIPEDPDGDRYIFAHYVGSGSNSYLWVVDYTNRSREGLLIIYGSIFQSHVIGSENSSATSGYTMEMILDPRGCENPPPCFPSLSWEYPE